MAKSVKSLNRRHTTPNMMEPKTAMEKLSIAETLQETTETHDNEGKGGFQTDPIQESNKYLNNAFYYHCCP